MTKVICDKCKKEIMTSAHISVIVSVHKKNDWRGDIDLCEECQETVYEFIFGGEDACDSGIKT